MPNNGTWDFGLLVGAIADGELREEASDELHEIVERLYDRARAGKRTVKGQLNIVLDIKVTPLGLVVFEHDLKSKLPRKVRRETPMYVGLRGLTENNPKQMKLGLREVAGEREIREPGDRAESAGE